MMFIGQGDDALIKRQVGIIFVLLFIVIALVAAFGLVIVSPKRQAGLQLYLPLPPHREQPLYLD